MKTTTKPKRCKACRQADATVQFALCDACYAKAAKHAKDACSDIPLEGQALEDLVISFFIGG